MAKKTLANTAESGQKPLKEQKRLLSTVLFSPSTEARLEALAGITRQELLWKVIKPDWLSRLLLCRVCQRTRLAAINALTDPTLICRLLEDELALNPSKTLNFYLGESRDRMACALARLPTGDLEAWLERLEALPENYNLDKPVKAIFRHLNNRETLEHLLEKNPKRLVRVLDNMPQETDILDLTRRIHTKHPKIWRLALSRIQSPDLVETLALESPVDLDGQKILHLLAGKKNKANPDVVFRIATQAAAPGTRTTLQAAVSDNAVLHRLVLQEKDPEVQKQMIRKINTTKHLKELAADPALAAMVSESVLEGTWIKHPDSVREYWKNGLVRHEDLESLLLESRARYGSNSYFQSLRDLFDPDDQWFKAWKVFTDPELKSDIFRIIPMNEPRLDSLIKGVHEPALAARMAGASKERFRRLILNLPDLACKEALILAEYHTGRYFQEYRDYNMDIRDFDWALDQLKDQAARERIMARVEELKKADIAAANAASDARRADDELQREAWEIDRKYR